MTSPLAAAQIQRLGTVAPTEWLWVGGVVAVLIGSIVWLVATGRSSERSLFAALFARAGSSLERITGLPAWCAAGLAMGRWALITAALGFYWDVAWHIDLGRDQQLFTPPHTLILMGLMGIGAAGVLSIIYATTARAPGMWRLGGLRIPRAGAALVVLGFFAVIGFPLDDWWHATYGIDVTMWSPTHLLMIDAAVLATVAIWALYAEAGPDAGSAGTRRWMRITVAGMMAVGLSALQLEFDDGVPQWQALYQPVLIAAAATFTFTAARVALGRGWALLSAIGFVLTRIVFAIVVGGILQHTTPHFPLYLGIALCVEAAFLLPLRGAVLARALTAGALAGTAGLAVEWGWSHVFGYLAWQTSLFPGIWAAVAAALAFAVLGAAFGGGVGPHRRVLPRFAAPAAAVVALVALAVPFPRAGLAASAVVHSTPAGAETPVIDRLGRAGIVQPIRVSADVSPADAADGSDLFWVTAWQGGGKVTEALVQTSPGHWVAPDPVPSGGGWKTILLLERGAVVAAAPVAMPDDPQYGQPAIPPVASRTEAFVPAQKMLMREFSGGLGLVSVIAYIALLVATVLELATITLAVAALRGGPPPRRREVRGTAAPVRTRAAVG